VRRAPRVLVVGTFDPEFTRNRHVLRWLDLSGVDVRVEHVPLWQRARLDDVRGSRVRLALRLPVALTRVVWRMLRAPRPDLVLLLHPVHVDALVVVPIARLRRVPLVVDVFISLRETLVDDRGLTSSRSPVALVAALLDRIACRGATLALADTPEDAAAFAAATGARPDRFAVLPVGAEAATFSPDGSGSPLRGRVLFYGTYIPLHGVDTIVRAAALVRRGDVRFRLVGDGQERPRVEELARSLGVGNVEFVAPTDLAGIAREVRAASLCLGVFGTSAKAARVVPNKVLQQMAARRPVLTAGTPAVHRALGDAVATVPAGDARALAAAIDRLVDSPDAERLAADGHELVSAAYSDAALAATLRRHLDAVLSGAARGVVP